MLEGCGMLPPCKHDSACDPPGAAFLLPDFLVTGTNPFASQAASAWLSGFAGPSGLPPWGLEWMGVLRAFPNS